MPSFTTLVESTSPLLRLSNGWGDGRSQADPATSQYSDSSFTFTGNQGSSMSFSFNGTGVELVGAMRQNHGIYNVSLDGVTSTRNGQSNVDVFQQTLFMNNNLNFGNHTLVLTNANSSFVDVDYILVTTQVGGLSEDLIMNIFKSEHPSFSYTPSAAWTTPQTSGSFVGASGQATQTTGASMLMTFEGDGVAIYGPVGPTQTGSYTVQIDGAQSQNFSAQSQFYRSQQILFFATGLGSGTHTVTIQNGGNGTGGELAIDFANVYTAPSLGGSYLLAHPNTKSQLTVSDIPRGIIATLAVLGMISLGFIFFSTYYFLWRRKRNLQSGTQVSQTSIQPFRAPFLPHLSPRWNNSGNVHNGFTVTPSSKMSRVSGTQSDVRPPQYED